MALHHVVDREHVERPLVQTRLWTNEPANHYSFSQWANAKRLERWGEIDGDDQMSESHVLKNSASRRRVTGIQWLASYCVSAAPLRLSFAEASRRFGLSIGGARSWSGERKVAHSHWHGSGAQGVSTRADHLIGKRDVQKVRKWGEGGTPSAPGGSCMSASCKRTGRTEGEGRGERVSPELRIWESGGSWRTSQREERWREEEREAEHEVCDKLLVEAKCSRVESRAEQNRERCHASATRHRQQERGCCVDAPWWAAVRRRGCWTGWGSNACGGRGARRRCPHATPARRCGSGTARRTGTCAYSSRTCTHHTHIAVPLSAHHRTHDLLVRMHCDYYNPSPTHTSTLFGLRIHPQFSRIIQWNWYLSKC